MNYQRIYTRLILKALKRRAASFVSTLTYEKHHILPRAMGGTDDPSNLVHLTVREHFLAHLLLARSSPTQIFACELIATKHRIKLKSGQRKRITLLRAALQRAAKKRKAAPSGK